MILAQIIQHFEDTKKNFRDKTSFSESPGVYAIYFIGKEFPISDYSPKFDEIIYIGKTGLHQTS
jgi:hypothetical protein